MAEGLGVQKTPRGENEDEVACILKKDLGHKDRLRVGQLSFITILMTIRNIKS